MTPRSAGGMLLVVAVFGVLWLKATFAGLLAPFLG